MAAPQTTKVTLQRDSLQTPWGFRLQGGADFRTPFAVNKINAGSPADGVLQRGDVILEIDQKPIGSMLHAEALELVQRAGGQVTFLLQRGLTPSPLSSYTQHRPMSAMPWSLANATSYLDRGVHGPWSPPATPLSPMSLYRSRPLERISDPKPLLSQTGSPLMPGPVPSVSTKTRGYVPPPSFHTERFNRFNTGTSIYSPPVNASSPQPFSPGRFTYPGPTYNSRNRTMSQTTYNNGNSQANSYDSSNYRPAWKDSLNSENDVYVPSYQKKVQTAPNLQRRLSNNQNQRNEQQRYTTVTRQQPQRPASVQPTNLVHRQFNSPMSLYSQDNVQEVMRNHVTHITRVSITPSLPKSSPSNYTVSALPSLSRPTYTPSNVPVYYVKPPQTLYASDY